MLIRLENQFVAKIASVLLDREWIWESSSNSRLPRRPTSSSQWR